MTWPRDTTPARSRPCSSSRTSRSRPPSWRRRSISTAGPSKGSAIDSHASWKTAAPGLVLRNVAGGWRLYTHPDTAPIVEQFVLSSRQARLTKAALETLSIVAYKQPVTRHQVSAIRGVNSDGVLRALTDRGLIEEAGREETPGRPVLYGTTPGFLERLGLPSLASLPSLAPLLGVDADGLSEEASAPDATDVVAVDLTTEAEPEPEPQPSDDAPA